MSKHMYHCQCKSVRMTGSVSKIFMTKQHAQNFIKEYRIARNFRGLKFSRFLRIRIKPRKFYPRKLPSDGANHTYIRQGPSLKLKLRKVCRRAIRKNFNPQKFLAIRYNAGHFRLFVKSGSEVYCICLCPFVRWSCGKAWESGNSNQHCILYNMPMEGPSGLKRSIEVTRFCALLCAPEHTSKSVIYQNIELIKV